MKKQSSFKKNARFIRMVVFLALVTLGIASYVSYLSFYGKNSYEAYSSLQKQYALLKQKIKQLQHENAKLQKEFLELKNLEPEWHILHYIYFYL